MSGSWLICACIALHARKVHTAVLGQWLAVEAHCHALLSNTKRLCVTLLVLHATFGGAVQQ
jgi:hypothetical protein